jgi:anion-transporting  ArsA/GET3 family ATPase
MTALAHRELIVVTGKGGVGKSTVTAALGRALQARGRRVLLCETDPRESLHRLLQSPPSDGDVVDLGGDLWHLNLRARDEIETLVRARLRVPMLARAVAASPVFRHFVDAAPGLKELAVLGYALRLVRGETGPGVQTVVLDAPATGHGVSLLAAPRVVTDVLGDGPLAALAGELSTLVADRGRCGVVAVALAEEMPVQETIELIAALEARVGRPPDLVIANALYPPAIAGHDRDALWARRRAVNDTELARLRRHWRGPLIELPLLPIDPGPALVQALADRLELP